MQKGQNTNHPTKGDAITVDPIRSPKDILLIKKMLAGNPRDFCLFAVGINTNLRASDLVKLTAGQVRHLKEGDNLPLREKKTGKARTITVNKNVVEAIQSLLLSGGYDDDSTPLFVSRKGNRALTVPSVTRLVKEWCADIRLKGNFGSHTLRKTFGYHHRMAGTSIFELMELFNHSSQKQTLIYLGIQSDEIKSAYLRVNL
jgi:integrase